MDLEHFDDVDQDQTPNFEVTARSALKTARSALDLLDQRWYTFANRKARWMDLLGDYAGNEPFIIDGESLLQLVLDDPLWQIDGRRFQILHAIYTMEKLISDFLTRSANIEIVFWEDNLHSTVQTGEPNDVVSSRTLARTLLFGHLITLGVPVWSFRSLSDPSWAQYEAKKKPMFIMMNDGGAINAETSAAPRIFSQRKFLFDVLARGIAVALLKGAEFKDSKILSFVYEQRSEVGIADRLFPKSWSAAADDIGAQLGVAYTSALGVRVPSLVVDLPEGTTKESCLLDIAQEYVARGLSVREHSSELLFLFILHCILLEEVPLPDRARYPPALPPSLGELVWGDFIPALFCAASTVLSRSNILIDIDGFLFSELVRYIILHPSQTLAQVVGPTACTRAQGICAALQAPPPDFSALAARFPIDQSSLAPPARNAIEPLPLLPFQNNVFDEELSIVKVEVSPASPSIPSQSGLGAGTIFSDNQHWHNGKAILPGGRLGVEAPKSSLTAWQRSRVLRSEQRFMAMMDYQARSLTGSFGTNFKKIVVVPLGTVSATQKEKPVSKQAWKGGAGKKLSSADKLRQTIADSKKSDELAVSRAWWKDKLKSLATKSNVQKLYELNHMSRRHEQTLAPEVSLYRLHVMLETWAEELDDASVRDRYTVAILRLVKEIYDQNSNGMPRVVAEKLSSVLVALGFHDFASSIVDSAAPETIPPTKLSFKFKKLHSNETKQMKLQEHPSVWQLRLFGEYMDRSMDSAADPRVSFKPDAWQRRVLDSIDRNESLLVVAPTSAGKTFISFYAMEKILRDSDDGILVYICPTKALVTQIAAEVYARFSKDLKGRSCWAVHTRDYRIHDPQKCQILVTVPEMLAIMLLSPPLARVWTSKIRRIILDEIHSIGQQEGGAVWEQIILLAPCPVIGLSATIGSPQIFNKWLQSVQHAHQYKHTFIEHPHRYSHLHVYQSTSRAKFLHPVAMLAFGTKSLPPDLALEAADTLSLYRAMVSQQAAIGVDLDSLEPGRFFAEQGCPPLLRQQDILRYEAALKGVLSDLNAQYDPRDASSPLHKIIRDLEDPIISKAPLALLNAPSKDGFLKNLIYLISDLHVKNELPAILFNFNRTECEISARALLRALEDAEKEWKLDSREWKAKLQKWEEWKLKSKERQRLADRASKQKGALDATADPREMEDSSWESSFDPNDPLPAFTFTGVGTSYTQSELDEEIRQLQRWSSAPSWALDALRRGIAVHHSGMNKRYRSIVETLFRMGYLRVVVATGTLALGINAPAKTTVFLGDSPFLTALMYRQCAGRAGRRGYDLLGNVVFYGLSMDRVQRLVLSKLPSLGGNFPLTSTLTLRLFSLLHGSDNSDVAIKAIKSMLSLPHISFGSDIGRHQLLHHLRFSIEYLRRAHLLDQEGRPLNLSGIAAHLYYTEPSNFALVALLRSGFVHKICQQSDILAQRSFIELMCHLFGRQYLPRTYTSKQNIAILTKKYPSMVVLPPLSPEARDFLLAHDKDILRVFHSYAHTYGLTYAAQLGPDVQLPLSKQKFEGSKDSSDLPFRQYLHDTALRVVVRSSFVANSGHDDEFKSIDELARTARQGLHLNQHAIPSVGHIAGVNAEHDLNAYILDFYTHEQLPTLASANGIRRGDVWYLLQDFTLTLATVKTTVEQLLLEVPEATADTQVTSIEEADGDSDEEEEGIIKRPPHVSDRDWRLYLVVSGALSQFNAKFRKMWA